MTPVAELLDRLRAADARVFLRDGRVVVDAPSDVLTPDVEAELRARRDELAAALRPRALSYPCISCGRFHYVEPTPICYWCRRGRR